jgi:xanthine/CO dehydrogenase XdhC/CoxF family maturation factor
VDFHECLREDAKLALSSKQSVTRAYQADNVEVFFDVIRPPKKIVVFGAEHDAIALVETARLLGWDITVVDTKCRAASRERFHLTDEVVLCRPEEAATRLSFAPDDAVVIMTHNYLADVELLRMLLSAPVCYLGILGPKARTESLLAKIGSGECDVSAEQLAKLHAPIGIDIGAETPEEVALAIVAEIKAVDAARSAGFLRERNLPIHDEQFAFPGSLRTVAQSQVPRDKPEVVCTT